MVENMLNTAVNAIACRRLGAIRSENFCRHGDEQVWLPNSYAIGTCIVESSNIAQLSVIKTNLRQISFVSGTSQLHH